MTIVDVFEAVGAHAAGKITDEELQELEEAASPGIGACGGQFTANTMAMAFEVLGLSPMGSAMVPAAYEDKNRVATEAGALIMDVLARGQRPRDIITREGAGERDRRDRDERRLHQRRAAPARARPRGRRRARHRRLRPDRRAHADDVRPQARRPLRRQGPLRGGRDRRRRQAAARGGDAPRGRRRPSPAARSASTRARRRRRPARRSCAPSTTRSRRPAAWPSCAATSRPRAR